MRVRESAYLEGMKPYLTELLSKLTREYPFASILAEDCRGLKYSVTGSGESVEDSEFLTSRGAVIRIFNNGYAEYAFDEMPIGGTDELLSRVKALMPNSRLDECPQYREAVSLCRSTEYERDPYELGDATILALLQKARRAGMETDARITDCPAFCQIRETHKLYLDKTRKLEQNIMWTCGFIGAYAVQSNDTRALYRGVSGLGGMEAIDALTDTAAEVARDALSLLSAEPPEPGEYTCVCAPDITGIIAHESFGHGVEMDMFVKNRALAKEYMGKRVASPLVTMHDSALEKDTSFAFFDDEGELARDNIIIERGILNAGLCDALSAQRLNAASTGNGRRERFSHKAYARMTATFIEAGESSLADIIATTKRGLLLRYPSSGMEDPKNWGLQVVADMALEIIDGRLTGRVFSPCVLNGNVPALLSSVDMVSDTVEMSGCNTCGKGYKEMVTVSIGGPYIRAKLTVS